MNRPKIRSNQTNTQAGGMNRPKIRSNQTNTQAGGNILLTYNTPFTPTLKHVLMLFN